MFWAVLFLFLAFHVARLVLGDACGGVGGGGGDGGGWWVVVVGG